MHPIYETHEECESFSFGKYFKTVINDKEQYNLVIKNIPIIMNKLYNDYIDKVV